MSELHPIVAVTGSSGAGTTSVKTAFERIFQREGLNAAVIEGDSFHRYDRKQMEAAVEQAARDGRTLTHFGPDGNLLAELEGLFRTYGETGAGRRRSYIHTKKEGRALGGKPGTFTEWQPLPRDSDLLFYEGLHGGYVGEDADIARHVDLLIGVVPVINLEWIQKLHRDRSARGYSTEAVTDTILRRMPDYVHYIVPQFARTHVNFQRVPLVDTSNPFVARHIPAPDESMLVIRFADPRGIDFAYLLSMLKDSFMSRANTIVCPGGKMDLAMQLIFTPMVWRLMERRRKGNGKLKSV